MRSILHGFAAAVMAAGLVLGAPLSASAQVGGGLIRDAEIETTIRTYATPLLKAAGIDPAAVHIYLIQSDSINAFVAGGQNIFVHTGLLTRSQTPEALIGVLAHEIGHIAGGHIARAPDALRGAAIQNIIAMILGIGAAVVGAGDAAGAILQGGAGIAQQSLFSYSIQQEQAADQAALSYLDATGQSARGLVDLLGILEKQELLAPERQSPYLRTHPLTRDRLIHVRDYAARSPYGDAPPRPEYVELHDRMQAKLMGFLAPPGATLSRYPESDESVAARYARAIAFYRIPDLERALPAIDALIADHPEDPYFLELKGQALFENGRVGEALAPYAEAVRLRPDVGLFRLGLAQAMIETNDPALNDEALVHLRAAVVFEDTTPLIWHYIGIAEGRNGDLGESSLALARKALLSGNLDDVDFHVSRAEQYLDPGSEGWLRLEDIKREAEDLEKRIGRRR